MFAWHLQVYLISTKAGSVGINLTAAFRMIIYDELWNPVHNAQVWLPPNTLMFLDYSAHPLL